MIVHPGNAAATGYNLTRSLRFRASASAYLNRTPASAGNRSVWTYSTWVKKSQILADSTDQFLFHAYAGSGASVQTGIAYSSYSPSGIIDSIRIQSGTQGVSQDFDFGFANTYRDPAAWYHIVVAFDTTQATASNRIKVYVNGNQLGTPVSYAGRATTVSQNYQTAINSNISHNIGRNVSVSSYFDGYLADVYFVDGQALTPASFGETNALTGVWQSKAYTGTYGTNGFYLDFEDTSSVAALGTDKSGNGNTWTVNNVSLTAGVTYDSMTDVPTLTSATAANYAVLNPLANPNGPIYTISSGNLNIYNFASSGNAPKMSAVGSFFIQSGKWYWEVTEAASVSGSGNSRFGITSGLTTGTSLGSQSATVFAGGTSATAATYSGTTPTWTSGDLIGFAFDKDALTLAVYKNGTLLGTFSGLETSVTGWLVLSAANSSANDSASYWNFGQRPFSYTPPTGFVALNTYNIPDGTITTSGSFTGNVSADGPSINLNGVPTAMTINGNAVTFGTHADKTAYGFKVRSSSTSYNSTGTNTYSITTTGTKFKYANAQGNP